MKRIAFIALVLLAVLWTPALGETSLINGEDLQTDLTMSGYSTAGTSGNQAWIRQFDGRSFHEVSPELFTALGYNGTTQYYVDTRDLLLGDEDALAQVAYKNRWGLSLDTSALTHRIARIPAVDPFLVGTIANPTGVTTPGVASNAFDLSPTGEFEIDRRVDDFNFRLMPMQNQRLRLVTDYWNELENGTNQLVFRSRAAGVIDGVTVPNGTKGLVAQPIDRNTAITTIGTDVLLGPGSAFNYRFEHAQFSDSGTLVETSPTLEPLNHLTRISSDTNSNIFKVRSTIGKRIYVTGVEIHRERTNDSNPVPNDPTLPASEAYSNAGQPLSKTTILDSTNVSAVFNVTSSLSLTGRFRRQVQDNSMSQVLISQVNGPGSNFVTGLVNGRTTSEELDATWTGLQNTFLRLDYEHLNADRNHGELMDEAPVWRDPPDSKINILRGAVRFYPNSRLNISANAESWNVADAPYPALPTDRTKVNGNVTYMMSDNLALYGDYVKQRDANEDLVVPNISINSSKGDKLAAGGQGYRNDFSTLDLGSWYSLSERLTLDVQFARIHTGSNALWLIGSSNGALLSPTVYQTTLSNAPFYASDDQWSVGTTYALSQRSRVSGRLFTSKSTGETMADFNNVNSLGQLSPTNPVVWSGAWNPVDINETGWSLGYSYDLTSKDNLQLNFSSGTWMDKIHPTNDGRFNLLRMSWNRQF